ncbi:hypothetical protein P4H94_13180, partial [Paenibacillus macerans]|uniref:hypothetical protein n=1 Tax=Paenibacillus macerans TaxID=44252 RepID=UPI002DB70986
ASPQAGRRQRQRHRGVRAQEEKVNAKRAGILVKMPALLFCFAPYVSMCRMDLLSIAPVVWRLPNFRRMSYAVG